MGIKHNVVLLSAKPLELSPTPTRFTPTHAEAVGKTSSVCVVLGGGVKGGDVDRQVQRLLRGAKLSATVTTGDAATHVLNCQSSGWALYGQIFPSDEITACVEASCPRQAIGVGSRIKSIALSSSVPIHVQGAYWTSTNSGDTGGN